MTKRVQIDMSETEYARWIVLADSRGQTVGEMLRSALTIYKSVCDVEDQGGEIQVKYHNRTDKLLPGWRDE